MSDPISTKTQSEITALLARAFFYRLLAAFFHHPNASEPMEFLKEASNRWEKFLDVLDCSEQKELKGSLRSLFHEFKVTNRNEWARQYENCFGHTAHSKVPAYELEYGEEHSHREPQELADITAFYQAFGLEVSEKMHERGDHISVECEFMCFLLDKGVYALIHEDQERASICEEAAKRFLGDHLASWVPAFAFRLSRFTSSNLMKYVAEFALVFVVSDCARMGLTVGSQDLPIREVREKEEAQCISCQFGLASAGRSD